MANTLFEIPTRNNSRNTDSAVVKQSKAKAKVAPVTIKGGGGIVGRINEIKAMVEKNLGQYKDDYIIIQDKDILHDYITECVNNKYLSIDTETDGLDPLLNNLAGICIYTYGQKGAYIPINHISYITNDRVPNQLPIDFVVSEFNRLIEKKVDIDMFNATFDIRFLRANGLKDVYCTWDGYLGARVLNENEPANLKQLHNKYCLDGKGDAFRFDDLFKGIPFTMIPIQVGYLYAAHDPVITTELCDFQRKHLRADAEREDMRNLYYVFHDIEMPCVLAVADMEDAGVELDFAYNDKLKEKYHKLLDDKNDAFIESYQPYIDKIQPYVGDKLENPINIASPQQLAVLLYDIMGCELFYDKKKKSNTRSTAEEALKKLDNDVAKAILEYRQFSTIVSTFIDKLPECVNPNDSRIHCSFNQYGADCIVGNSLLLTDKGYVPIKSIFDGTEVDGEFVEDATTVINRDLDYEKASHRIVYHNTDTIKVSLRGGYSVEGTPNHPIIVSDLSLQDMIHNRSKRQIRRLEETQHFKTLDSLCVGDTVAIPYGYNIFPTEYQKLDCRLQALHHHKSNAIMPDICNEEFAELLGMYHADGVYKYTSKDRFSVTICNTDADVQNRVVYLVKSLFNVDTHMRTDRRNGKSTISFGGIAISDIRKYLCQGARNKRVPDIIMKSPKSVICAYIKGMTLDSTFDRERQRLFISCVDDLSFKFLQDSLSNMGILTQYRKGKYLASNDHMGNAVSDMNVRRLGIMGEMYGKFLHEVGVVQSSKALYLDSYKKPHYLTYNNVYYAYVTDIEQSTNDVFDLHIPNSHSFIANSMINHNTGRFSSSNPNMQNIPSKNHDIRKMFKATDGYVIMSADYSQQEIKGMAQMCGDQGMIEAFRQGKDFYAEIASVAFNQSYEECLEHFPKGSYIKQVGDKWYYGTENDYDKIADGEKDTYADGKSRRAQAKSILLGINYGRGAVSIAEQIGCTPQEAEKIKEDVFKGFPAIAEFERQSYAMVEELGYITTLWGRKRRLPSMLLPDYDFEWLDGGSAKEDPIDFSDNVVITEVPNNIQEYYRAKLSSTRKYKEKQKLFDKAKAEGIRIIDHTKDKDYTKVVNARIQGTAADMTKLAMAALNRDERLRELGFRMIIQVHDEILAECPIENAKECSERFAKIMSEAPGEKFEIPINCDVTISRCWYGEELDLDTL